MEKLKIHVCGTDIHVTELGKLTSGMVGATASFTFSPEWSGLLKTAVFMGSGVTRDVTLTDSTVQIPPECLTKPISLFVGVYGHLEDGTIVIPTVMSGRIGIAAGAKPSGDTSTNPTLPVWAQMLGMIGDISHLTTEAKSSLVAALNELAKKSGGKVDTKEIQRFVQEYLAAHPPTVAETDPTVPTWAKQPNKPSYTPAEVGADPAGTAAFAVSGHNVAAGSHADIRLELKAVSDRLNAFFDSDDATLDELSEIVAYITSNKSLIESITTSKVGVTDIVNNLVTNAANKPLSAAQGVVLKGLIDTLTKDKLDADKLPPTLPNPNALTFTGAVQGSYDGSKPLSVEIPQGGGSSGGGEWELITDITIEESISDIYISQKSDGTPFEYTALYILYTPTNSPAQWRGIVLNSSAGTAAGIKHYGAAKATKINTILAEKISGSGYWIGYFGGQDGANAIIPCKTDVESVTHFTLYVQGGLDTGSTVTIYGRK